MLKNVVFFAMVANRARVTDWMLSPCGKTNYVKNLRASYQVCTRMETTFKFTPKKRTFGAPKPTHKDVKSEALEEAFQLHIRVVTHPANVPRKNCTRTKLDLPRNLFQYTLEFLRYSDQNHGGCVVQFGLRDK